MPKNSRKKQLLEANREEEKTIRRLEKALKLKRRRKKKKNAESGAEKKSVHNMFKEDGLDYILGALDGDGFMCSDASDDEMLARQANTKTQKKEHIGKPSVTGRKVPVPDKPRRLADLLCEEDFENSNESVSDRDNDYDSEGSIDDDDHEDQSVHSNSDGVEDEVDGNQVEDGSDDDEEDGNDNEEDGDKVTQRKKKDKEKPKFWEDIYGRIRDKKGNVVNNPELSSTQAYVPPAKRLKTGTDDAKKAELLKIQKQLKRCLNKLSESNMQPICAEIDQLYMKNSRNDMNETLYTLVSDLVISTVLTPPRLIMEQAMMIAVLHASVGAEVGAYFLQNLAKKFKELQETDENYGSGKLSNNLLIFLSHLYNFKVTRCTLVFDILKSLIDSFKDKDIELIQVVLKTVGFSLRKDNPLNLKEVVLMIQKKAPSFKSKEDSSRVQFMLDTLVAIRNNNMYKIPDYDPTILDHMRRVLKGILKNGFGQELDISLADLLNAEEKGRWWIVGSAWSERTTEKGGSEESPAHSSLPHFDFSDKILELARKQRMNTDTRKTIFCILMTAEDYMDAFAKLLRLNLRNLQEREILIVILHCVLNEKTYNPYYAYLAGKFCQFARKYFINLQFALWDKFKELMELKPFQVNNLAYFLRHLFIKGDLPISVLKVIHFAEMNKTMVRFFRLILQGILLHDSEETCTAVFRRVAAAKNLNLLREGLRLFMHHFILQNTSKLNDRTVELLKLRVKVAETALNSAKHAFKL